MNEPMIIAGPCSAESREQVLTAAARLAPLGITAFRAGVWKPRTHPGCFEGYGATALRWLAEAKEQTGLPTATEVASAAHLEEALDSGVDILWLGARTTTNPFTVQEIADAARAWALRHGRPTASLRFLVKNPANPDLELWIGAIQRLRNAGITDITAIHRGFSVYGDTFYRNPPQWQIPMELRRRMPGLRILSDPSHIGGKRELVAPLASQAMRRGFDGLIVECHPWPDKALSDSRQQITPDEFSLILQQIARQHQGNTADTGELSLLRGQIDGIDDQLMELMRRRMEVAREIGRFKQTRGMNVVQPDRYDSLINRRVGEASTFGLSAEFVRNLLSVIHEESVRQQLT